MYKTWDEAPLAEPNTKEKVTTVHGHNVTVQHLKNIVTDAVTPITKPLDSDETPKETTASVVSDMKKDGKLVQKGK